MAVSAFLPQGLPRCLRLLFVMLWLPVAGRGQSFQVVATDPVEGATSVPLSTRLTFSFDREFDLTNNWNDVLLFAPADSVTPILLTIGDAATGDTDVIFYDVEHTPDTDFTWLVYGVRADDGTVMNPFVLRYTTAADMGTHSVSGTVSTEAPGKRSLPASLTPRVWWVQPRPRVAAPRQAAVEDGLRPPRRPHRTAATARTSEDVILFLADRNLFFDPTGTLRAGAVTDDASGTYVIPRVRDGVYWPLAVKDLDEAGGAFEALGFYDADGDEQPDSIIVNGADLTGIDMTLFDFTPRTATVNLDAARDVAARFAPDQRFYQVEGRPEADGKALDWLYAFYSPAENLETLVLTQGFVATVDTAAAPELIKTMLPIPDGFVDSDAARATADAAGGAAFINQFPAFTDITTLMRGGNQYWIAPRAESDIFWEVRYIADTDTGAVTETVFVDMITGNVIEPVISGVEEASEVSAGPVLGANYPNPFGRSTTLPFTLPAPAQVAVQVYDVLGRLVATPAEGWFTAGPHRVVWRPEGLAPGLYFYRLEAGRTVRTGRLVLRR